MKIFYILSHHDFAASDIGIRLMRSGFLTTLALATVVGFIWAPLFFLVGSAVGKPLSWLCAPIAILPWILAFAEPALENWVVRFDVKNLTDYDFRAVALVFYSGGHPGEWQPRFAYVALAGEPEDPWLVIIHPTRVAGVGRWTPARWHITFESHVQALPLKDVRTTRKTNGTSDDPDEVAMELITRGSGRKMKQILHLTWTDRVGQEQQLEVSEFRGGEMEMLRWRNWIISARFQGDTGIAPRYSWEPLPSGPTVAKLMLEMAQKRDAGASRNADRAGDGPRPAGASLSVSRW